MVRIAFIITVFLAACLPVHGQDKFDYKIDSNTSAIVVYKLSYDSVGREAILVGTKVYRNGVYYPLAFKGGAISSLKRIGENDTVLSIKCKKIISILDSFPPANLIDFIDCKLFADSMIWNSDTNYTYGGEQFKREEPAAGKNAIFFYVAFHFSGDLLFVAEGAKEPYYMRSWACRYNYQDAKGFSDPTVFLLTLHSTRKLSAEEQQELGLTRLKKFAYTFYCCY